MIWEQGIPCFEISKPSLESLMIMQYGEANCFVHFRYIQHFIHTASPVGFYQDILSKITYRNLFFIKHHASCLHYLLQSPYLWFKMIHMGHFSVIIHICIAFHHDHIIYIGYIFLMSSVRFVSTSELMVSKK